jgi:O-antigen/teichoic acid export membrane protein
LHISYDGLDDARPPEMPSSLVRRLRVVTRGPVVAGVLSLAGGSAAGQIAVLAAAPFLTRLFTPAQLGQFGLLQSFVAFAAVGLCLRLDLAIVSAASDADAKGLLFLCMGLCAGMSLLATAGMGMLIAYDIVGFGALEPWVLPATFGLLFVTGAFVVLRFWSVRERNYREIATALTYQGAGRAALPVVFGALGFGWGGLVAGELAGRALGIRSLGGIAWQSLKAQGTSCTDYRGLFGKYRQYWSIILPSSLLDALALALPVPIIVATYGMEAAGWWVLVNRVAMAPGQLAAAAVADVFHAEAVRHRDENPGAPRRWLLVTLRPVVIGGLLVYGLGGVIAPRVFSLIFGPDWTNAGLLMLILVPALILTVAVGATGRMLMVMERGHWKLIADLLNVAAPIGAFYGGVAAGLTFLQAAGVYCLAYTLANLVYLAAIWHSTNPR